MAFKEIVLFREIAQFKGIAPWRRIAALALLVAVAFVSAAQGLGTIAASAEPRGPETLIGAHADWKYEDSDTDMFGDIAADFRSRAFDDSAWKSGAAPLGYPASESDNGIFGRVSEGGTLLGSRERPDAIITYYLRTSFTVEGIAEIARLDARLSFDDGYVMYLNGHEIDRAYMGDAAAGHGTDADYVGEAREAESKRAVDLTAARQYLVTGENVIAVDLHNRDGNSSDIYWGMTLTAIYEDSAPPTDADVTPGQVNVHVGGDAATEANFTFTTIKQTDSIVTLSDGREELTFTGENSVGAADKYFHKIVASGLSPATVYTYTLGTAPNTFEGKFKTAPAPGSKESFKFIYLADTQVANADNAEALGATLSEVAKMDPDFVYLAGDITDTATSEAQWEGMFKNAGGFPDGGQEMFGNFLIAAIQGNHDNSTFNRHINAPAQQGNVVYSFDYGPATFVMLNLETARSNAGARAEQKAFLTAAVNEAKARGQWVAVGFHKSLYTGASHITDSDVVEARTYWCPVFAQLDVDFVLQGHDHVYSRGFVAEDGTKGMDAPSGSTVADPENIPLYMIGGHAGGLKWYALKNYTVSPGDPLIPGYAFLDIDSANPAHNADGLPSDVKREQVIVELDVSAEEVQINCYMFKYDEGSDTIATPKYLYDSLTVRKAQAPSGKASASISGPSAASVKSGAEIRYVVSYANAANANAFDTEVQYDSGILEFVRAESVPGDAIVSEASAEGGKARLITGLGSVISGNGSNEIAAFVFKVRSGAKLGGTTVAISRADTVEAEFDADGAIVDAADVAAEIIGGSVLTDVTGGAAPGDSNGDGSYTLADLSIALGHFQATDADSLARFDMNGDGVVGTADYIMIAVLIRG
ncbi:MAG: metallophosphoesterase [Clostridiales Family XIII bacterium]|jgi:hypothetical protein|nr:metallophosphoesterase [Clostridiales Family XIII bacterium]